MNFQVTPLHRERSRLAKRHQLPDPELRYQIRVLDIRLEQHADESWWLVIGDGNPLPATDVEVCLWQALQAALR